VWQIEQCGVRTNSDLAVAAVDAQRTVKCERKFHALANPAIWKYSR